MLGVPKLETMRSLTAGRFSRVLVSCVLRSRIIPDVVRTDRGPEMTSAVMNEFNVLCNSQQIFGAAYTPRHQGPGELKHVEVMQHWLLLMHHIAGAFSTEWCKLAPVVEYLIDTEINETGFSAYELQTGYALLESHDVTLAPFHTPRGTAETDTVAKFFFKLRSFKKA